MPEQSIELLIEFTRDDDPRTRATAIAGLAKVGDPRGYASVLVALFDPVDEVRVAAAMALGVFDDARSYEPLVEGLDDPCDTVAVNCAWALGQTRDARCLDKLLELVADEGAKDALRTAAAMSLGERAAIAGSDIATSDEVIERVRVRLLDALETGAGELRAASVWSLGHLPADKQTTQTCIELLEDEYEWVVRYAVEALAHFGDEAAIAPLEELADYADDELREVVYQALDMLH